jgi:RHS repeat-associated protein
MRSTSVSIHASLRTVERVASRLGQLVLVVSLLSAGVAVAFGAARPATVSLGHTQRTGYSYSDIYQPQETYGGTNPIESCAGCDVWGKNSGASSTPSTDPAEMVNPATGDLTESYSLFSTPAIGSPLGLTLSYDSLEAQAYTTLINTGGNPSTPTNIGDVYGYGWVAQTGAKFWVQSSGGVSWDAVVLPDGAVEDFFVNNNANPNTCPAGMQNDTYPGSTYNYCGADRVAAKWGYFGTYGTGMLFINGGLQTVSFGVNGPILYQGNLHNEGVLFYNAGQSPNQNGCPGSFNFEGTATTPGFCTVVSDTINGQYYAVPLTSNVQVMGVQDPAGHDWYFDYSCNNALTCAPNLTSVVDPNGNKWNFTYDSGNVYANYVHDLTGIWDPNNNETSIAYTAYSSGNGGLVSSIQDAAGNAATTYSGWNVFLQTNPGSGSYATTISNPDGQTVQDQYTNLVENATSITGSDSHWNTHSSSNISGSDPGPYTEVYTDPMSNVTTTVTDAYGNLLSTQTQYGTTSTAFNVFNEPCWSALPGITIPSGTPSCATPPAQGSGASFFYYDADGDLTESIDPTGVITYTAYDTYGHLCWQSIPGSSVTPSAPCSSPPATSTRFSFDPTGELLSESTPDGNGTSYSYDATTYTYNGYGEVLTEVTPDGNVSGGTPSNYTTTSYYDPAGRLYKVVAPLGRTTTDTLDAAGNLDSVTDPAGDVTSTAYDKDNRTCWSLQGSATSTCSTVPAHSTVFSYYVNTDNPSWVEDPNGNTSYYTYADQSYPNAPTQVIDPSINYTSNVYDPDGNLCVSGTASTKLYGGSSDPACASTLGYTWDTFDQLGNVLTSQDPNGNTTTYARNQNYPNDVNTVTPPSGGGQGVTTYTYDMDGRMHTEAEANGDAVTVNYNPAGTKCWQAPVNQPASTCSTTLPTQVGTDAWAYNYSGLPYFESDITPSGSSYTAFTYDAQGQETAEGNAAGTVGYGYDFAGDNNCVAYPVVTGSTCSSPANPTTNTTVTYGFDADGRMHTMTDWFGKTSTFNYDTRSNLTSIQFPATSTWTENYGGSSGYDYDNNPTQQSITSTSFPTVTNPLPVNTDDFLSSESGASYGYNGQREVSTAGSHSFGYYQNGEMKTDSSGGVTTTFTNNADDELMGMSNATAKSSYAYDPSGNRCASMQSSGTPSCTLPTASTTTYSWTAFGQLCGLGTGGAQGCNVTQTGLSNFYYDGEGLRTTDTVGGVTQKFAYDTQTRSGQPLIVEDGSNAYLYGPANFGAGTAPIEQISLTAKTPSYLFSLPSGVNEVVNAPGAQTESATYSTYGVRTTTATTSPFGFQGGYTDASGLVFLVDRYYDPATDQFLSVDPLVAETGQPYAFGGDNPVNEVDPTGMVFGPGSFDTSSSQNEGLMVANAPTGPAASPYATLQTPTTSTVSEVPSPPKTVPGPYGTTCPAALNGKQSTTCSSPSLLGSVLQLGNLIESKFNSAVVDTIKVDISDPACIIQGATAGAFYDATDGGASVFELFRGFLVGEEPRIIGGITAFIIGCETPPAFPGNH